MLNAQDVVDFFLSSVDHEDGERITHLKLQKLLYYAQGYSLAILDRPIFKEPIENWRHGPVVSDTYYRYKNYGSGLLPVSHIEVEKYDEEELYILNRVRIEKGQYSAWRLAQMTHQEYPWLSTNLGETISIDILREYFCKILPKTDFNFDLNEMKEAVTSPVKVVPDEALTDFEAFDKWVQETF